MRIRSVLMTVGLTATLSSVATGVSVAAPAQLSPVAEFPTPTTATPTLVAGAWSSLTTNASGATVTLHTSGLDAGHAITVWWVVFNNPGACNAGHFGFRCGPGDLANAAAEPSVLYAAGHVIGSGDSTDFGAHLSRDDTSQALFGPGLINPTGADIHLVVHDHGPADPTLLPAQIHSFDVCNTQCHDVQVSVHEQ